jgi:hypothetical protein
LPIEHNNRKSKIQSRIIITTMTIPDARRNSNNHSRTKAHIAFRDTNDPIFIAMEADFHRRRHNRLAKIIVEEEEPKLLQLLLPRRVTS